MGLSESAMSNNRTEVTETVYEPDNELDQLLSEVLHEASVSYGEQQDLDLSADIKGFQRDYDVTFGEFDLSGFETYTSLGGFVSLEGHLGLAAAMELTQSLVFGVPTQSYTDEAPPASVFDDPYQDLTAEWYRQEAVEMGFPESRLEKRIGDLEHDPIDLEKLERYARVWLSSGGD